MADPLKAGFFATPHTEFGKGPGEDVGAPIWKAHQKFIDPDTLLSFIANAETHDITVFANVAGERSNWTDLVDGIQRFNPTKYEARLRRFTVAGGASQTVADALTAAFTSRRLIAYVMDEPFHRTFGGTIPNSIVNNCCLLHKSIWPGCITVIRAPDRFLTPPTGGWTGLDYGWAQLSTPDAEHESGLTPRQYFQQEKAGMLAKDLGMIPGFNWINSGDRRLWDHDMNPSTAPMRVWGDLSDDPGRAEGDVISTNRRYIAPPDYIKEIADAIWDDPDAPAFIQYIDCVAARFVDPVCETFQRRSDFVAAWDYMINKFNTRATWNGWRTAKGSTPPPPPPPTSGGVNVATSITTRVTSVSDTYDDVVGAELDEDLMEVGHQYLILVSAQLDYSVTGFNSYARVVHGSTAFSRSEISWQRPTASKRYNYFYWTVWTAVADEDVKLQVRQETGRTDTVGVDQIYMCAIDLNDLPAGSVQFAESAASTALNGTYADGATKTFTPAVSGEDWLILTLAQYTTPSTTQSIFSRLNTTGGLTETDPEVQAEGEDAVLDIPLMCTAKVVNLTNVAHTFAEQSKNSGGGGPRVGSQVLALNLNGFAGHDFRYTSALLEYTDGTPLFNVLAQTAQLNVTEAGQVWAFAFHAVNSVAVGVSIKSRIQIDQADDPATQTSDNYSQQASLDTTDVLPVFHQSMPTLSPGVHTLDLDASFSAGAGVLAGGYHRLALLVQLGAEQAANETPVWDFIQVQTVNEGETLSFTISASDAEDVEADLSYTVVTTLPAGAQFDNDTRTFVWTPDSTQAGTYFITFRVEDLDGATADTIVTINVVDVPSTVDFKELRNLRYDHSLQGGRIDLVITWNGEGNSNKQQGITGIEVEYTDLGRI